MRRRFFSFVAAAVLALAAPARAHDVLPGYLELKEQSPGDYAFRWTAPSGGGVEIRVAPVLPEGCALEGAGREPLGPGTARVRGTLRCEGGLAGKTIAVDGLDSTLTDVLLDVTHADGRVETRLLSAASPSATLDAEAAGVRRAASYLRLGVTHILMGVDHLLFVLGLVLIVSDRWMLVKTITSFTLAHSLTLAVATLGLATAPLPPLNAAIALSILFLGPEVVRTWRGETSFTIRHPWVVAFAFGLLHGFGFASGLAALGLPRAEVPLALLLFNVGVEIGQIFFVAVILLLERSFRALEIRWPRWAEALPGYTVGSLGAYWTIQRTVMMFAGAR